MRYARNKHAKQAPPPRMTPEQTAKETAVMLQVAEVLDPLDREKQLRVMEVACVMLGEDAYAKVFREGRLGSK